MRSIIFIMRDGMSLTGVAEARGISRRMVSYYRTAHKPIPRAIRLACLRCEASQLGKRAPPRGLPTAPDYAAMHA